MTENTTEDEVNREQLLSDIIDYITQHYDIDENQISTGQKSKSYVTLRIKGPVGDFPGFGHSTVPVIDMSDELRYGYVPRHRGKALQIWTEKAGTPAFE